MRLTWTVFYLTILFSLDLLQLSLSLKSGDNGVCVAKISTKKTRVRMVTINKWCGKKKCVKKKVETYTVPQERVVCCNGWEYDVNHDSCGPICSTGCAGGHCVAPEVCHCDPPAILDPAHKNTCIQPECDPPCVNAQCGQNNTCSCLPGFNVFNTTHCYKCEMGYAINEDFNCNPLCEPNCKNGHCTAPNTCACNGGFKILNSSYCEPVCELCVNSTCVAPNECKCFEGFEEVNKTTCVPKCENCEGDCVEPNVCVCRDGYKAVDGSCRPVCGACNNGVCSAPGQCTCNDGYMKNETDPNDCVRNCTRPVEVTEL